MKTSDFDFNLPPELIAQYPSRQRGSSRLLVLDRASKSVTHSAVSNLSDFLEKGSVLVFNNSKVRKARIRGNSEASGKETEFLLVRKINDYNWIILNKHEKDGSRFIFQDGTLAELNKKNPEKTMLSFNTSVDDNWLDRYGHVPLPPYIKREDELSDSDRYQCVYAAKTGSSAAPTAGLHFTEKLMEELRAAGMDTMFITLHVGPGTFLPDRTENIEDHTMHEENYSIEEETADIIEKARKEKRKIIAVGTTSLRALESAWDGEKFKRGEGATSLFLYPGKTFRAADGLFTNFHTPKSTLLMLVCAFAGKEFILDAYAEAVRQKYRFFSYGDATLII